MFSKSLFKQSCKANGIMWGIITFAVCFMLACVMLISGNGNIGGIRTGITGTIVESAVDSQCKTRAINYYNLTIDGLTIFDTTFDNNPANYVAAITAVNNRAGEVCEQKKYAEGSDAYKEIQAIYLCPYNVNGVFDEFYATRGSDITTYLTRGTTTREDYARQFTSVFLAHNMTDAENVTRMVNALETYTIDYDAFVNLTYKDTDGTMKSRYVGESGYKFIKNLSINTIVTFKARLDYETSKLDSSSPTYGAEVQAIMAKIVEETSSNFLSSLPADVSSSLEELGSMDLFGMIIGSIFYKMAGLLLPIIYIIMVANNLIAGQVDSGSMAYVLSTSTKRKQVIFTQAVFLVSSLFAMCALTTATSCVCLAILDNAKIGLTYGELILLNVGAFVTLFAMSGVSFLASCWFNRSKYSMSLGGGINMFFLVATMLGLFGSDVLPKVVRLKALNFFNYCSIISLFDEISILGSTTTFIWKFAILVGIGIICYTIGGLKFEKKDLPL